MKNASTPLGVAIILLLSAGSARAQYTTAYITLFDGLTGYHSAEDLVLLPSGTVAVSGVFTPGSTTEFFTAAFTADGTPQWTNGLPDSIGQAWKIFQLNDGTLLSLGDFENHTGTNDVLAQRYSPTGVLLGQVVIDSPGLNNGDDLGDATMDAEGNVYLTGTFSTAGQAKPGLARLTPTGALDWWVTYPVPAAWNGFGLGLAVEAIGDSLVVLWTRNGSSYSAALGFAPSGAHLWTTDLQVTTNDNNNAMTTDGLGHVLVGGAHDQQFNVTKLDANGDVAWSTDFAFPGLGSASGQVRHVRCDTQGDVYAVGEGSFQASIPGPYLLLAKLSSAGNVLWMDTLTGGSYNYCLNMDHALLHDDRWTIATAYVGSYLYEYDTTGTRLFRQAWNVPGAQHSKVNAIVMGPDGALHLAGRAQLVGSSGDGFVAKLAPLATGIDPIGPTHNLLYPNPATDRLQLPMLASGGGTITISDIRGKAVYTTSNHNTIDVSALPSGVYFLERTGQHRRWRFVKE